MQGYDSALVRLRGTAAATNFALSNYRLELGEFHGMQKVALLRDTYYLILSTSYPPGSACHAVPATLYGRGDRDMHLPERCITSAQEHAAPSTAWAPQMF